MPFKQTKNLDAYDVLLLEFAPPDNRLRRFLRRMAYISTPFFVLELLAVAKLGFLFSIPGSWWRMLANGIIIMTWLLMWIGYTGWLFEYCLGGFNRKKIWVAGAELFPGDYSGKAAQAWAILGMILAIVLLALAMTPVFFLFFLDS